jgi:microcystin-dependent protein
MSDQFVAEIRIFGFSFPPTGWAFCNGQLLPISQNTALFSLLGTTYGGDGKSTFALPNLQGDGPVHAGQGAGLSQRFLGQQAGVEFVTLIQSEMPAHSHAMMGANFPSDVSSPTAATALGRSTGKSAYHTSDGGNTTLSPTALSVAGGSLPHNNLMPYLTLNFCIALQGVFPPRS